MTQNNNNSLAIFPNSITMLNLLFGVASIVLSMEGNIGPAAICIGIAAACDFFDGFVARLVRASSELGAQLDSLADMVSFGVAPAIIMYQMIKSELIGIPPIYNTTTDLYSMVLILSPLVVVVCGAYRLARFNTDSEQAKEFKGLPIPGAAIFLASFAVIREYTNNYILFDVLLTPQYLAIFSLFAGIMMVSSIPMFSFKFDGFGISNNLLKYIFAISSLILLICINIYAIPIIVMAYIIVSLVRWVLPR
ncbi:MAG: CDP-diacylglycerol--serine O-phosphatidyltransferase [Bacteroidales bacterium]